jgi:hypothetical protein
MAWASTVPAAISGLVAAFKASDGLPGVKVLDGPAITSQAVLKVLAVGWTPIVGEAAVEAQSAPDALSGNRSEEQYTVRCTVATLAGSTDVGAAREAAYDIFSAACDAIGQDQSLGKSVMRAYVGGHSLVPEQIDRGMQINLVFEVNVEAFTSR